MKTSNATLFSAALLLLAAPANAQEYEKKAEEAATATAETHIMVNPDAIEWQTGLAALPAGVQIAVLEGDLEKEGPFTFRLKFPAGLRVPPHMHPGIEHVTVISGEAKLGMGETLDEAAVQEVESGAFFVVPAGTAHFALIEEETVVQVHGIGPWGITYVNPADDPRNAAPQEGTPPQGR